MCLQATDLELLESRGIKAVLNLIGWWELSALLPEAGKSGSVVHSPKTHDRPEPSGTQPFLRLRFERDRV